MTIAQDPTHTEPQITSTISGLNEASVREVMDNLKDGPGYSSVRTLLKKLVEKGPMKHKEMGLSTYVYLEKI